jgi:hypothetical protein
MALMKGLRDMAPERRRELADVMREWSIASGIEDGQPSLDADGGGA